MIKPAQDEAKLFSIQEAAKFLNVSIKTLQRWDKKKILITQRSSGGHRRYTKNQLEDFKNPKETKLFSVQKAAKFLNVSIKTLHRWDQKKLLVPQRSDGGHRRYVKNQLDDFKNSKENIEVRPLILTIPTPQESRRGSVQHATEIIPSLPSALSSFPSDSFLKHHFLLTSKDKLDESDKIQSSEVPSVPEESNLPKISRFQIGLAIAVLVLIPCVIGVVSFIQKNGQSVRSLADTSVLYQDFNGQAVLAAADGVSDLNLNINVPSIFSQSVGIGITTPEPSAILDLSSADKGFLAPRMTTDQRDAITSPATGLFVYNTITNQYEMYNGTLWKAVGGGLTVGDVTGSEAFTEAGTAGKALWFNGTSGGKMKVTAGSILGASDILTLPDTTGTFITTGNLTDITKVGTLTSGTWNGSTIGVGNGGTGATTLTGLLLGNGTSAITGLTTSAGVSGALSDETGTGSLVFNTNPVFDGNLVPTTTLTSDLGSAALYWDNLYVNNIVGASSGTQGYWQRNDNAISPTSTTDDLLLGATGTSSALIKFTGTAGNNSWINTGNVGIGTTSPSQKLSVTGDFSVTATGTTDSSKSETTNTDFNAGTRVTTSVSGSASSGQVTLQSDFASANWTHVSSNWLSAWVDTAHPVFVDIDEDGDYDLAVGDFDGYVHYFRNDGTSSSPSWTQVSSDWLSYDVGGYAKPTFIDIDGDGDYDLVTGNNSTTVYYFRNDGTSSSPSWIFVSSNWLPSSAGTWSSPTFADIDNDGDYDLAVGNSNGTVYYFRNDGTSSSPSWTQVSTDWLSYDVGTYATPAFADIDGDGDYDLAIGDWDGLVHYFRNDGTSSSPSWTHVSSNWLSADVGNRATPTLVDIDGDGDYDLAAGDDTGYVEYFRNDTPYYSSGTFTSQKINTNQSQPIFTTLAFSITEPANTNIQFQLRSASTLVGLDSATWYGPTGTGDYYTSSGTAINSVHNNQQYIQYKAYFTTTDTAVTPRLEDIAINYNYYSSFFVDSSGNLGIGTVPTAALDINSVFKVNTSGVVTTGSWQGTIIDTVYGGTGLSTIGTANQMLGMNSAADGLEYKTLSGTTNQINVTNTAGSITLSTPQSINTAATPTFAGLTLSAFTSNGGPLYTNGSGLLGQITAGTSSQCLLGGTTPTFGSCGSGETADVFWNSSLGAIYPTSITSDLLLGAAGTSSALIKFTGTAGNNSWINTGNVGIGTTSPSQKLSVTGDFSVTAVASTSASKTESTNTDFGAGTTASTSASGTGSPAKVALQPNFAGGANWTQVSSNWLPADVGNNAAPSFADIDGDGDYDMAAGNNDGYVYYFRNDGTSSSPSWTQVSTDWLSYDVGFNAKPAFADIDGDGDYDMAVGNSDGYAYYFRNDGTSSSPSWTFISSDWLSVDVGSNATPALADMDGDGDLDLAVGNSNGYVYYFRNDGTSSSPSWTQVSSNWLPSNVGNYATPTFADIDGDGDYDLVMGLMNGAVSYFRNDGTSSSPSWTQVSSDWLSTIDVLDYASPALADIDGDGDYDMAVGNQNGYVYYFRNDTPYYSSGTFTSQKINTNQSQPTYTTLDFSVTKPTNTDIQFQLRSSTTLGGLDGATWYGPTSTGDYYTSSGIAINSVHNNQQYIQYKAYLSNTDTSVTPTLNDITINYNYYSSFMVDSSGNLGIGVAPSSALDINSVFKVNTSGVVTVGSWQGTPVDATYGGTGLSSIGTANQMLGMNAAATGLEYKALSGTTNQINITNTAGSIILSTPQNIHASATPSFAGLTLSNTGNALNLSGAGANLAFTGAGLAQITTASNQNLALMPAGTGRVGIGTTAPLVTLDVRGNSGTLGVASISGTTSFASLLTNNNGIGDLFTASKSGATKFVITNAGDVGIGTAAPTAQLELSGDTAIKSSGTTWANPSDLRLKDIVGSYTYGLSEIMQINPVVFTFKENNALGINDPGEHIGIIAQQMQNIIPEAVITGANGYLQFNMDPVMWAGINAIKEQEAQIASISAQPKYTLDNDPLFKDSQDKVAALESGLNLLSLQMEQQASVSAFLVGITGQVLGASTSAALDLGDVELNNATVSGDLNVLGRTTLTDLGVTGNINAGVLAIHGIDGEIGTLAGDLNLQKQGLGGLNILDGKVVIDTSGNMTVAGDMTVKKINIDESIVDEKSIGETVIPAGEIAIEVKTSALTPNSHVFVSPDKPTEIGAVIKDQETIRIMIKNQNSEDIKVNWWIVN